MKERFKAIVGVFAVFIREDRVLLARRCNTDFANGCYSLPAGHLEPGESLAQAMIRELKEEVGVEVTADQLMLLHVQSRNASDGHRIHFFFSVHPPYTEPCNMEPDKCDGLSWCSLRELPDNTIPYIREVLAHIQAGRMYSDDGWS